MRLLVSHGECLLRRHVPVRAVCVFLVRRAVSGLATSQTPLIGFVKDSPPSTSLRESTPERAVARSSVRCVPSRALVPSLSFHPTPTVYSSHSFVGLLHPTADPGVRRVLISAGGGCKPIARRLQSSPLRRMPFEAFPSPIAGFVSPRSVPSHRWFHHRAAP